MNLTRKIATCKIMQTSSSRALSTQVHKKIVVFGGMKESCELRTTNALILIAIHISIKVEVMLDHASSAKHWTLVTWSSL